MSNEETWQNAADEARQAARTARELARLLDEYATQLVLPERRQQAEERHLAAALKLQAMTDHLAASDQWREQCGHVVVAGPERRATPEEITEQAHIIAKLPSGGYTVGQVEQQFRAGFHAEDWGTIMDEAKAERDK